MDNKEQKLAKQNMPKSKPVYTAEEFAAAYNQLCRDYGFTIRAELGLKQQIDGYIPNRRGSTGSNRGII